MITGLEHTREIDVTDHQLRAWTNGNINIQDAMPNLTPDEREVIMTGITPEEWQEYVAEPEDVISINKDGSVEPARKVGKAES